MHRLSLIIACLSLVVQDAACRHAASPDADAPAAVTINGRTWRVELAVTPPQRYQGLSGRPSLPGDRGMLFVFEKPQALSFCMRGCLIDLDIAFIDADRRVLSVQTMYVEPDRLGLRAYQSPAPALYALETPAGQMSSAAVKPGDMASFSRNVPAPAKSLSE